MSFVAIAIGGSAVLGAGASIYAGSQQASAAGNAANAQVDAQGRAITTNLAGQSQALAYLDPFRQYGLNAGSSLQAALYSPQQQMQQLDTQKAALEGEVARLQSLAPRWEDQPILTGKNASERRAQNFQTELAQSNAKVREAQAKLETFNKSYETSKAQAQQAGPKIQESPGYQFQADLLGRNMDRFNSARGLTGSGFEAEERRVGLLQLGATETENQFNRLKGIYDVGANASIAGAGAITGTAQNVGNLQVGQGQAQAQGYQGVAGANANAASGVANSATGAIGAGLNYYQFQNLIQSNNAGMTYSSTPLRPTGFLQTPPR